MQLPAIKSLLVFAAPVSDETVDKLRHRLIVMKEILNEEDDPSDAAAKKKAERRKKTNCLDTIIDGSFMGVILVNFQPDKIFEKVILYSRDLNTGCSNSGSLQIPEY